MLHPPLPRAVQAPTTSTARPHQVTTAARLMVATAMVSAIYLIVTLIDLDGVRDRLRDATPRPSNASVTASLTISLGYYVLALVLLPLFTRHVTQGRNWARLSTWGLVGIGVATTLSTLGHDQSGVGRVLSLAVLLLEIAIASLLVAPASSRYFRPLAESEPSAVDQLLGTRRWSSQRGIYDQRSVPGGSADSP